MYMTEDFRKTQTRKFNTVYVNDKEEKDRIERERQYQEFLNREKNKISDERPVKSVRNTKRKK